MGLSDDEIESAMSRPVRQLSRIDELGDYETGDPRIFIDRDTISDIQDWQRREAKGPDKELLCRDVMIPFTVNRIARSAKAFLKQNNLDEDSEEAHLYWRLRFMPAPVEAKQSLSVDLRRSLSDRLRRSSSASRKAPKAPKPLPFSWLSKGHFWLTRVKADGSPLTEQSPAIGGPEQSSGRRSQRSSFSSGRPEKNVSSALPRGVPTAKAEKVEVHYDQLYYKELWSRQEEAMQQVPKDARNKSKAQEPVMDWTRYSLHWLVPIKSKGDFLKEMDAIHWDRREAGYEEGKKLIKRCAWSEGSVAVVWSRN